MALFIHSRNLRNNCPPRPPPFIDQRRLRKDSWLNLYYFVQYTIFLITSLQ